MDDKSSQLRRLRIDRTETPVRGSGRAWWILVAILVLAAGGGGAWLMLSQSGTVPIRVAVARPAVGDGQPTAGASLLDASGYVVARRQATVSAKITGKVTEVLIEEGQHVDKGQVVGRLDDSNARAALDQAQAQVNQAQAQLKSARVAYADAQPIYERSRKQSASDMISRDSFDNTKASYDGLQTAVDVAERTVAVAQSNLAVAERNEDDTVVKAPFAGVITVKAAQPGEIVSPISAGGGFTRTGIGTIVDMDSLEGEIDVNENFINRVHAGQPAMLKLNAYPDWQIPAAVIAVIPTADRSKATLKVRVGIKQKDPRILPEMGLRVAFLAEAPAAPVPGAPVAAGVVVPAAGVAAGSGETGTVFVLHDDRLERRSVRLGARTGDSQTILAGLAAGDRIALGDLSKLAEDTRIKIED
ncbi:MAG TPA: efflux RND transporter periplasmic adaptor subunit [Aliidongia sp.]|uniref:efflux RND transporter periplasmic adaptor subunit n=1 Tax=Aliidongia sp. TaxID=1914230 RepID=UPI002DDDA3FA|nr:efflux RND transporter periplasmic adaptor subunit [Aliidongia sp.]HEV2676297.1 efflux RND transporter periplasmic adaptor subunit [Aliidongia sp.]